MKIVCISTSQIPSERANSIQVMKVCQALAQLEHRVILVVPDAHQASAGSRDWDRLASHYGLKTVFEIQWIPFSGILKRRGFSSKAVQYACGLGAELIYTRTVPVAVMSLLHRRPVILEMHELPSGHWGPLWYRLFLLLPGKKRLLALTHSLQRSLENKFRYTLPEKNVMIAPSGVDLERFEALPDPETARRQLGLPIGPTVVCTGHLYPGRGANLFLRLAGRMPQVHFLWVGGSQQDLEIWRVRLRTEGLHNITFTGFIPNQDLPRYQAAAEVLVMPYQPHVAGSSGGDIAGVFSPLKMFEYMASGRPILCSDLPALREVLTDKTALFYPAGDLDAWQAALKRLLADGDLRARLGQAARLEVGRYSWLERSRRALVSF